MPLKSKTLKCVVTRHVVEVLNLPDEPENGYHGLPGEGGLGDQLRNAGHYIQVDYCDGDHPDCDDRKCDAKIYRKTDVARAIESNLEKPNTLPCGHSGLHTIKAGEQYMCHKKSCGKRFDRETVEVTFFQSD